MQVCIISAVFPPEPVVSAKTSAQVASAMVSAGSQVVVITAFPSRPSGKRYAGFQRKLYKTEISPDGYRIIRCFTFFSAQSTLRSRLAENLSFGITSGLALALLQKPDVIYANTWPIFSAIIIYCISKLRRIPLILSVQDLYPESLVTQKRIHTKGFLYRLLLWIDSLIARGSHAVIVLTDHFAKAYRELRNVDYEKIHVVPNWANIDEIELDVDVDEYRKRTGIPKDGFVLVYAGNIGEASGIDTLLIPFRRITPNNQIYLILAGEGSRLGYCREIAKEIPGMRVKIHSPWDVSETSLVLRSADLLLLPTRNDQSLASIPSKLIYYMLASRPIFALAHPDSEIARIINRAQCGWVSYLDQPEDIMEKILWIINNCNGDWESYGRSGRDYAINHFSRESCLPMVISIINTAAIPKNGFSTVHLR